MEEVSGPIIAIALVLCAVFVPTAFVSGLTGQFYRQFALTIAISTVISAFNSLTLSPALASRLLLAAGAPRDRLQRGIDALFGWFFRRFNRFFTRGVVVYTGGVARVLRVAAVALVLYAGLIGLTGVGVQQGAAGLRAGAGQGLPGRVRAAARRRDARSHRTVIRQMSAIALEHPGVANSVAFPGLSINGFVNALERRHRLRDAEAVERARRMHDMAANRSSATLNQRFAAIQEAFVAIFPPPPVQGLGQVGGFKLYVEDRAGLGFEELYRQLQGAVAAGQQEPALAGLFSSFQVNVPQIDVDVDRERAKTYGFRDRRVRHAAGVSRLALRERLQPVRAHLSGQRPGGVAFRLQPDQIARLKTRNAAGAMVPLGSRLSERSYGPDQVMHYNGFPAAEINGGPAPGFSSGQAQDAIAAVLGARCRAA